MTAGQVLAYYYIDSENRICCEAGNMAGNTLAVIHVNQIGNANLVNKA
jgi:hypothetical protein